PGIEDIADLASAGPSHISFLASRRYLDAFRRTRAGAVLVPEPLDGAPCPLIVCADPYLAMAHIATAFHPTPSFAPGCEPGAHVAGVVDPTATVCVGAVVEPGASVGPRTVLMAGAFVGRDASLGEDCLLHPGARVLARCRVGARVILHTGAVIGSDGFGYALDKATGRRHKIPQVGIVEVGDDVEIGANSTVDRATFGSTRIGAGTKIDNLVQIAHNVVLGRDCVVVSQTGIAGSTVVGDRVVIGAQGGVVGHISIASDVMLGARAGVASSIDTAGVYSGTPVMPHRQWLKVAMAQQAVPELRRRVRELESRLAALCPPREPS
ncbi:MAG TPA: UDP-3-O-(3-hydroxymyristoyl)glucosamine N-acyltransferase, partial [Myxococcota bacterium]|nr:UDP-3-O-(3-hydroxymyristoyl)glucosamine N-acyltransferase [Myxococcota bacterium]